MTMLKETVRGLCKQKGITVQRLEKEVGLSNGTISKWNKAKPTVDSLNKVANYFGITVVDILKMASNGDALSESNLALEIERQQDIYERNILATTHLDSENQNTQELIMLFKQLSPDEQVTILKLAQFMKDSEKK